MTFRELLFNPGLNMNLSRCSGQISLRNSGISAKNRLKVSLYRLCVLSANLSVYFKNRFTATVVGVRSRLSRLACNITSHNPNPTCQKIIIPDVTCQAHTLEGKVCGFSMSNQSATYRLYPDLSIKFLGEARPFSQVLRGSLLSGLALRTLWPGPPLPKNFLTPGLANPPGRWLYSQSRTTIGPAIFGEAIMMTEINKDVFVFTVFLGLDHQFFYKGPQHLFETVVFGGKLDGEIERYSTWEEAEKGHKRWAEKVKGIS